MDSFTIYSSKDDFFSLWQAIHWVRLKLQICLTCEERQLPSHCRLLLVCLMHTWFRTRQTLGLRLCTEFGVSLLWLSPLTLSPVSPRVMVALGSVLWFFSGQKDGRFSIRVSVISMCARLQLPSMANSFSAHRLIHVSTPLKIFLLLFLFLNAEVVVLYFVWSVWLLSAGESVC